MIKKIILPSCLSLLLLFSACTSEPEPPKEETKVKKEISTIKSTDNNVELEINEQMLPESTSLDQIKIEKVSDDKSLIVPQEGETVIAYDLQPNGLQLKGVAWVSITGENTNGSLPIISHIGDDGEEYIPRVEYIMDEKSITARIPISHFSQILWYNTSAPIHTFTAKASNAYIGERVPTAATVTRGDTEYVKHFKDGNTRTFKFVPDSEKIKANILARGSVVEPSAVHNRPPKSKFTKTFTINSNDFTCVEEGKSYLTYSIWLDWIEDNQYFIYSKQPAMASVVLRTNEFKCMEKPLEEEKCMQGEYQTAKTCKKVCDAPDYCSQNLDNKCWACRTLPDECKEDKDCPPPQCDDGEKVSYSCETNPQNRKVCEQKREACKLDEVCVKNTQTIKHYGSEDAIPDTTITTLECAPKKPKCGNNIAEIDEDCDGKDLAGLTCQLLGYDSGELSCTKECTFDLSKCKLEPKGECNNGKVEKGEACDKSDLNKQTCKTQGFDKGTLTCSEDCTFDTSKCEYEMVEVEMEFLHPEGREARTDYDYTYDELSKMSYEEIQGLGAEIKIPCFRHYFIEDVEYYFPFPEKQFSISGPREPCSTPFVEAPSAIAIDGTVKQNPDPECGWGTPDYFHGVLKVSPAQVADWMKMYKN